MAKIKTLVERAVDAAVRCHTVLGDGDSNQHTKYACRIEFLLRPSAFSAGNLPLKLPN